MAGSRGSDGFDSLRAVPGYQARDEERTESEEEGFEALGMLLVREVDGFGGKGTYVPTLTIAAIYAVNGLLWYHGAVISNKDGVVFLNRDQGPVGYKGFTIPA